MANVILVAYLLIVLALIVVILLQRSEGGALGIGGGGGGFMTARGSANLLTRTTAILATLFFATAIGLTILSELDRGSSGILQQATEGEEGAAPTSVLDALNSLQSESGSDLSVPAGDAPANGTTTPAPASDLAVPQAPADGSTTPAEDTEAPAQEPAASQDPAEQPAAESTTTAPATEAPATQAEPDAGTTQTPAAPAGN
jgi:preprotein translocase subunit SecG